MTANFESGEGALLTHLDGEGAARMVDVGGKAATRRFARAEAIVRMTPATATAVRDGDAPKGDVVGTARIESSASTVSGTGVEMEALVACSVAALALYDMVKGIERGVSVERMELIEKTGGKSDWRRDG